eukprot:GHVQ01004701.1.p1 GENE.GHVQ01004701.1~~GHVQ01004701.1.p1  ORF type:complete len:107 (+),score=7.48 GHVQ01004701.1:177-497(+)
MATETTSQQFDTSGHPTLNNTITTSSLHGASESKTPRNQEVARDHGEDAKCDKLRHKIREAFKYLDKVGNGTVFAEDLGTMMRFLGQFPDDGDILQKILPQVCLYI